MTYDLLKIWTHIVLFIVVLHLLMFSWKIKLYAISKIFYLCDFENLDKLTLFRFNYKSESSESKIPESRWFLRLWWDVLLTTSINMVLFISFISYSFVIAVTILVVSPNGTQFVPFWLSTISHPHAMIVST
jgi:hypothetical protein